ncbi:MAG: alpha/beta fold hydrolase [Rhizomicrobium sp.]
MRWRQGEVQTPDGPLAYHRTGGPGPVLVLAHGLGDYGLCWTRVASTLEADFDVVMFDARGHGRSARMQGERSPSPADDVCSVILATASSAVLLMGHSVGARAAAECASLHPELVQKLILVDPPLLALPDPATLNARRKMFHNYILSLQTMSDAELHEEWRRHHPHWHECEFQHWATSKRMADPGAIPNYSGPWQRSITALQMPTLLIYGDAANGSLVRNDTAREAETLSHKIQLRYISEAGHSVHREAFDAFVTAVRAFLSNQ